MSLPGGEGGSGALNDDQIAAINRQFDLLVTPVVEGTGQAKTLEARSQVTTALGGMIIDQSIGIEVGDVLSSAVNDAAEKRPDSTAELFAVWGIIKRVRQKTPDAILPRNLIEAVHQRAVELGELDITVLTDIILLSEVEEPQENITVTEQVISLDLGSLSQEANDRLDEAVSETFFQLDLAQHLNDIALLRRYSIRPKDLLEQINIGAFKSEKGLAAAKAQQDRARLTLRGETYGLLFEDINAGRYLTGEGLAAARIQHDSIRLSSAGNSYTTLHDDFMAGRYFTDSGRARAMITHDRERMAATDGSYTTLFNDIHGGRYLTQEGIQLARETHDSLRLILRGSSESLLREDLENGRYLTKNAIAEAKRRLGIQ